MKLKMRTVENGVRKRVLAAVGRIAIAEAAASIVPAKPEIITLDRYTLLVDDPKAIRRVGDAFPEHFPADRVQETRPGMAAGARLSK